MSDTEYTPSAGNVRSAWEVYHREYGRLTFEEAGPAFDRWLAEHDRQVAERAWDEGQKAGLLRADFEYGAIGYQYVKGNPYTKGLDHG